MVDFISQSESIDKDELFRLMYGHLTISDDVHLQLILSNFHQQIQKLVSEGML
jgi:hypothetical protein